MLTNQLEQEAVQLQKDTGQSHESCLAFITKLQQIGELVCDNNFMAASVKTLSIFRNAKLAPFLQTKHFLLAFYVFSLHRDAGDRYINLFLDHLHKLTNLEDKLISFNQEDPENYQKISVSIRSLVFNETYRSFCSLDRQILENYFLFDSNIFP